MMLTKYIYKFQPTTHRQRHNVQRNRQTDGRIDNSNYDVNSRQPTECV